MKYISAGLFALAAAYLEVNGKMSAVIFLVVGVLIAIWGQEKSLITINNIAKGKDDE